jgi:hypothetical protein
VKSFLALDLSIRSTGFAWWKEGQAKPVCGTWELAPHINHAARAFVRLHRRLLDLHDLMPIDDIVFEEAVPPHKLHGNSSAQTIAAAAGLAAHVMSFAEAIGANWRSVSIGAWRKHFVGSMPRGTKTPEWKHLAMMRCREFEIEVLKHDAAEAAGMLDYQVSLEGIVPPWRQQHILQRELVA